MGYPLYMQNLKVFKNIGHISLTYRAKCSSIKKHARNINIDESRLKVETLPTNACSAYVPFEHKLLLKSPIIIDPI